MTVADEPVVVPEPEVTPEPVVETVVEESPEDMDDGKSSGMNYWIIVSIIVLIGLIAAIIM
ncbi:MAG: hypothetical protein ACI8Y7_000561 [Candidatus Woesearchaeota archaeon]|jgi:hypothetical protein